jgi:EmrB/QacA subfamily drug resistance transporter
MAAATLPSSTRWWTLSVVSVGTFMLMLDLSVVAIALPQIHSSLHSTFSDLQWVVDAYALTLAVFLITGGSVADRVGRKRIFQWGLILFTSASLMCGVSGSPSVLIASRGLQGVGAAMLFAVGPALLGNEFHGKERATAFAAYGAVVGLAIASGPLIGGGLTSAISWRWIFFINVPIGIIGVVAAAFKVPESLNTKAHATDWLGMATFSIAMGALVFAIIRGSQIGWSSLQIMCLFATSFVFFALFVVIEFRHGEAAMFDMGLFRNRTFVGISLVALIANGAGLPSVFIETNFVENVLRSSAWSAGLRFLPLTLSLFAFGALAGLLTGKVPFRLLMGVACVVLGVGLFLTRLVGIESTWLALIPSLIVTGAGMGMFNPTRAALAIGVVEPERSGVASGINETFQQVGTALGIAAVGALFQNQVVSAFVNSRVGLRLGERAHQMGFAISAGSLTSVTDSAGRLKYQVSLAARSSFVFGFHDAMTICGVVAFVAAIIAVATLRTKDLHSSALSLVPPDVEELTSGASVLSGSKHVIDNS